MKGNDNSTSISTLKSWIADFIVERNWQKYHNPKNLAMSISIEAAELMELFQWHEIEEASEIRMDSEKMERVREELADVLAYCLSMANQLDIDIAAALYEKIQQNGKKYPIDQGIDWHNKIKI